MKKTKQIADRFREVILNGTWVANTNYKDQLSQLTWKEATTKVGNLNTIAVLTFHINYYIAGVLQVFEGGALEIRDKYSFDAPPIQSQEDWEKRLNALFNNAEKFANRIEEMPDQKMDEAFVDPKYGSYQRNIDGMIEHSYYHLGQISLIKKMLLETETKR
ncbi:DUF1572 domain-containing protein [Aquimarina sp. 2201CG5-10]|uniref:DUF1572 domain-containing protein n=1 Tax=Aquimarina callyspongiae TaxID=3098150 RepID=UPI002AB450B1|nr:DUF1572 domain-containing protein [Aquimarina sp. 2201CG5-10]MDY8137356.1 DUF1572 domain-containing protein [Aquimarina sp. 2201CG5-10]